MTLRLLCNLLPILACAVGCAGKAPGERGDPYAPVVDSPSHSASQPATEVIGPAQRYPLRTPPPAAPKLTIADDLSLPGEPDAATSAQVTATSPLESSAFSPPTPIVPPGSGAPAGEIFKPGQIVAQVGDQIILYGEVVPLVNQMLAPHLQKAATRAERQEILSQREAVIEQAVRQMVETKLLYYEFLREIPRDKVDEAKKSIKEQVASRLEGELATARREMAAAKKSELEGLFRKDPVLMRLAALMNEQSLETTAELDAALRRQGSSLKKEINAYIEYHVGRQVIPKNIDFRPEVTHQEMLDYYREHAADFAVAAKARFEILTVYYKNFPTPQDAERALAEMGNAVYLGGASFGAVAQKSSQEPAASEGGQYDWTTKGSLASAVIDEAIFTLPVGKLSQILRDERGCHIVRVHERLPAGQISFTVAQAKIKEAIVSQKREKQYREYIEGLRSSTPVWTIYDDKRPAIQTPGL